MKGCKVEVRFYAKFKEELGLALIQLELEEANFRSFLKALRERIGEKSAILFRDDTQLRDDVLIAINEQIVGDVKHPEVTLNNGAIIDIMPLPSGG
ncbi:MAG: MoaD/ThiS family protein [Thermoprotei archaeon]|nr:MoaD/ThiS family protein [Thermoprotei archaeon]